MQEISRQLETPTEREKMDHLKLFDFASLHFHESLHYILEVSTVLKKVRKSLIFHYFGAKTTIFEMK